MPRLEKVDPEILEKVVQLAIQVQQVPAPTFQEDLRRQFVFQQFQEAGLVDLQVDQVGNVYARLPGYASQKPLVISAHLDTVFPPETELQVTQTADRISGPGIGDNSLGVASLLGLVWLLKKHDRLQNDLWLVANVGEEGMGNLRGMRAVVDRFEGDAKAYIILEGMALGFIYHRGLNVKRFRVQVNTPGGHSWVNFGRPSAIHELARFIVNLQDIEIPAIPRTSYNVGTIHGGISVNTIAAQAEIELDLRSESGSTLDDLVKRIEQMVCDANRINESSVEFKIELIGERPYGEMSQEHPLVKLAQAALERQKISPRVEIGSTDANIPLSKGYPALCIGITRGSGAHTLEEYIEIEPIQHGLAQVLDLVRGVDQSL